MNIRSNLIFQFCPVVNHIGIIRSLGIRQQASGYARSQFPECTHENERFIDTYIHFPSYTLIHKIAGAHAQCRFPTNNGFELQ